MKSFVAPLLRSDGTSICTQDHGSPIAWLDQLLMGGFDGPSTSKLGRPHIVLVAGPPGAGKSLLVQQICYNIARYYCKYQEPQDARLAIGCGSSLYLTTEASSAAILMNLKSLGLTQECSDDGKLCTCGVLRSLTEEDLSIPAPVETSSGFPLMFVGEIGNAGLPHLQREANGQEFMQELDEIFNKLEVTWHTEVANRKDISLRAPQLVAIDSLNVFPGMEAKRYLFEAVLRLFCKNNENDHSPKYVMLVLEVPPSTYAEVEYAYFEHISDISIRVDHGYGAGDYFSRSLEIKKNRFKSHALGRHVVKIFPKPEIQGNNSLATDPEGARPHINSGGVFVFPSVHFILSAIRSGRSLIQCRPVFPETVRWAKKPDYSKEGMSAWGPGPIAPLIDAEVEPDTSFDPDSPSASLNWPTPWCFELVGGGVPLRQCTALVGHRGARKSYFGYQFLLDGIANGEQTLVVSFRDNPTAVLATMNHIAQAPHYRQMHAMQGLHRKNPVVVYQRAGYVTPEELLHRVMTAVGEYQPTRVVINSVDQWDAGYPLLAECSILVPALIDFLNSHGVTSMIVGVEGGRPLVAGTGLTAKAEVVLSFDHQIIRSPSEKTRCSLGPATDTMPRNVPLLIEPLVTSQSKVVVRAVRVPRGAAGYGRAIIDYMEGDDDSHVAALTMYPLAPEYPLGDPA